MRALVLSGGGAHGAYEAGVVKALLQRDSYDLLCGVSIGAINAALVATGRDDALESFWHHDLPSQARDLFPHVPRLRRLLDNVGSIGNGGTFQNAMSVARAASEFPFLRNLANVHKTSLPAVTKALSSVVDFAALRTSLLIGATNTSHARAAVFYAFTDKRRPLAARSGLVEYDELDAENFVRALLASSAMPGLFSPIELTFEGRTSIYADGCMVHSSPLDLAIDNGATEITIVFVDPELQPAATVTGSFPQMAFSLATLWQQRMLDYEMQLAEAKNEIARLGGASRERQITIRYVRPERQLDLDLLAFDDAAGLARLFALGVADGAAAPRFKLREAVTQRPERWLDSLRRILPISAFRRGA